MSRRSRRLSYLVAAAIVIFTASGIGVASADGGIITADDAQGIHQTFAAAPSSRSGGEFPMPKVVNVYEEWTPVNHGDPLRDDATLYYAPPSLERVRITSRERANVRSRSHARSGDARSFADSRHSEPLVIAAQPMRDDKAASYSVYGTPGINYSEFYHNPPPKKEKTRKSSGRSNRRNNERSGVISRRVDSDPLLEFVEKHVENSVRSHKGIGGGFQVMEPPSRQSNDYFYYRPNSPHYEDHDHHGHGGGDLSTSASNHNYNYERKVDDFAIEDLLITDAAIDEVRAAHEERHAIRPGPKPIVYVSKPPPPPPAAPEPAQQPQNPVYSFKNTGYVRTAPRRRVPGRPAGAGGGPVYRPHHSAPPPASRRSHLEAPVSAKPVAVQTTTTTRPRPNSLTGGRGQVKVKVQQAKPPRASFAYPLGQPVRAAAKYPAGPEFYPIKDQPASYKSKTPVPKLEGVFGSAFPQVPEPKRIQFSDLEEEYSGQISYRGVMTAPRTSRNTDPIVTYSSRRDMDYSKPPVIMRVKESGELYVPNPDKLHKELFAREPVIPGGAKPPPVAVRQYIPKPLVEDDNGDEKPEERSASALADWLPNFTDVLDGQPDSQKQPAQIVFADHLLGTKKFVFPDEDQKPKRNIPKKQGVEESEEEEAPVTPNYTIVVGASHYNTRLDEGKAKGKKEDYSTKELYGLCIKEVSPDLRDALCSHLLVKGGSSAKKGARTLQRDETAPENALPILNGRFDRYVEKEVVVDNEQKKRRKRPSPPTAITVISNNAKVKMYGKESSEEMKDTTTQKEKKTLNVKIHANTKRKKFPSFPNKLATTTQKSVSSTTRRAPPKTRRTTPRRTTTSRTTTSTTSTSRPTTTRRPTRSTKPTTTTTTKLPLPPPPPLPTERGQKRKSGKPNSGKPSSGRPNSLSAEKRPRRPPPSSLNSFLSLLGPPPPRRGSRPPPPTESGEKEKSVKPDSGKPNSGKPSSGRPPPSLNSFLSLLGPPPPRRGSRPPPPTDKGEKEESGKPNSGKPSSGKPSSGRPPPSLNSFLSLLGPPPPRRGSRPPPPPASRQRPQRPPPPSSSSNRPPSSQSKRPPSQFLSGLANFFKVSFTELKRKEEEKRRRRTQALADEKKSKEVSKKSSNDKEKEDKKDGNGDEE